MESRRFKLMARSLCSGFRQDRLQADNLPRPVGANDFTPGLLRLRDGVFHEFNVIARALSVAEKRAVLKTHADVPAQLHYALQVRPALLMMPHTEPDRLGRKMI